MRALGRVLLAAAVATAGFAGITWLALEAGEVAVLHTAGRGGSTHATRVWVADNGGFVWIEAATPERPFYRDAIENPAVELERGGMLRPFVAEAAPEPQGHDTVRRLLRAKYGLADRWVGLLQDTSRSVALRLAPGGNAPETGTGVHPPERGPTAKP